MDEHRCRVPVDSNFKHVQTILLPLAQIDGYSTDLQLRTYYARKWEIQGLYHLTQWISIYNHLPTTESLYQQEIVEGPFNGSPSSSKKLGEHCTFEQPPTTKQSTQLAFSTCESMATEKTQAIQWLKIKYKCPNRYGCFLCFNT